MTDLYRYAAFISYSSKDAKFARRLHRALEHYGIPSSLGKFDLIGGGKRNRIYPVFRDREELAAGRLGDAIEANLRASAALIVVCSPNASASPWVQKEIEYFVGLGRGEKIFAIVADNAPLTDAAGVDATLACFPPAFRGDALSGDKLEPLAADARRSKDGFRNAWLKIVAGMIGVSPGQIIDRDRRHRAIRNVQAAGVALVVLAAAVVGGGTMLSTRLKARSDSLAELARVAADAEDYDSAARYSLLGLAGADLPLIGFDGARAEIELRRAAAASPLESVLAEQGDLRRAAFSSDQRLILARGESCRVGVWDMQLRRFKRWLQAQDCATRAGAFVSSDGARIGLTGNDGVIRVFDSGNGSEVGRVHANAADKWRIFTPDGAQILAGGDDGVVHVYDVAHGGEIVTLGSAANPAGRVSSFSADGSTFATNGKNTSPARVWRRNGWRMVATLPHTTMYVVFSANGARLAATGGASSGEVIVWDVVHNRQMTIVRQDAGGFLLNSIAISADGAYVAAAGRGEGPPSIWDAASGRQTAVLRGHTDFVNHIAFSPDGRHLATASSDATARIWTLGGDALAILHHRASELVDVNFSADGKRVITTAFDGAVRLWRWDQSDQAQPEPVRNLAQIVHALGPNFVEGAAISPDLHYAAGGGPSGSVSLMRLSASLQPLGQPVLLAGHGHGAHSFAFSPQSDRLASGGDEDGTVRLWDIAAQRELLHFGPGRGTFWSIAFSGNGRYIAGAEGLGHIWDAESGRELHRLEGHAGSVFDVAFSPDSARLATASEDGTARVWDVATGRTLLVLRPHPVGYAPGVEHILEHVGFSGDGRRLVTISQDRVMRIWDAATGLELFTQRAKDIIPRAVFSANGEEIRQLGLSQTLWTWRLPRALNQPRSQLIQTLCSNQLSGASARFTELELERAQTIDEASEANVCHLPEGLTWIVHATFRPPPTAPARN